ncbi:MAG: sugar phosphate isomerase/epimerase, partial [Clostridia bacterium]|nr:sugar phosphate isomerase/epimerase [Clostridia bacterium]
MKLSFSTKGWHNSNFDEFCSIAEELKFQGIELHNIYNRLFTDKDGAFHDYAAGATLRKLYEKNLKIPCIDTITDVGSEELQDKAIEEIESCIRIASNLHIPYIRLRANRVENVEEAVETVYALISKVLQKAKDASVTLLLETTGPFSDTAVLRDLLDRFASNHFAALWQMSAAYFGKGESPEEVIKNLGAYVRHVQFNDAKKTEDGVEYCLAGEGELPIKEIILALRSVNY